MGRRFSLRNPWQNHGIFDGTMKRGSRHQASDRPAGKGRKSQHKARPKAFGAEQDVVLRECKAETEVTSEALNRALALLVKWALRGGREVLEEAGVNPGNLVSGHDIKGYGANDRSN
jgi:hypothetical protein